MKRHKMNAGKSKRLFSATASRTHRKNLMGVPMRGGIRM